jgi:hypothetical protein
VACSRVSLRARLRRPTRGATAVSRVTTGALKRTPLKAYRSLNGVLRYR